MTTRYNAKPEDRFGVPHLPTGYDSPSTPDLTIPGIGIIDVDRALFELFDKEIALQVTSPHETQKKVPIVFGGGEKWAVLKRGKGVRDRNGTLILPLVTVIRTTITQSPREDISGRGMNQQTGEIVIKRRLGEGDRSYQQLINRLALKNQTNLAVDSSIGDLSVQPVTNNRKTNDLQYNGTVEDGGLLYPNKRNNVWEYIVVPSPQFYTATYEVIIWTQYIEQMSQIIESLISSFLPQGNAWRLTTKSGYWFVAGVDGNLYTADNNYDDMTGAERLIKYKFTIKVPAYIFASPAPGIPVPIRRYVSSPEIQFDVAIQDEDVQQAEGVKDPFLGADDPTLPLANGEIRRRDQRNDNSTLLYPGNSNTVNTDDPALRGRQTARYRKIEAVDAFGNRVTKYLRIQRINKFTGEVVYAPSTDLAGLTIIAVND